MDFNKGDKIEQLLKEIDEVLEASRKDMIIAIAFLRGMKTALMLGLNKDGEQKIDNLL